MNKLWVSLLYASIGLVTLVAQDVNTLMERAQKGDASSQNSLGLMYGNGQGVPQNYVQSMKWYRLAADQGYASAQYNLGLMYDKGQGVPQDYAQAAKWYRLAADQGDASAQFVLGSMYGIGQGVPFDLILAHMWSNLAAAQGYEKGKKNRDTVAELMSREQIERAQELARNWKPKKK